MVILGGNKNGGLPACAGYCAPLTFCTAYPPPPPHTHTHTYTYTCTQVWVYIYKHTGTHRNTEVEFPHRRLCFLIQDFVAPRELVCCSVMQCAAVCCSASHCVAVCCIVLQRDTWRLVRHSAAHCSTVRCSALLCVAVWCSALRCVAVRCSALQCVAVRCSALPSPETLAHPHNALYVYTGVHSMWTFCHVHMIVW